MHMKLLNPESLLRGTDRQRQASGALRATMAFEKLSTYGPVLAGAIPLNVDTPASELEIFLTAPNLEVCGEELTRLFTGERKFRIDHELSENSPAIAAYFEFDGFPFKIFAQDRSVLTQPAVLCLLVEARLLAFAPPGAREKIREFKLSGLSTESAFAACFEIDGDPRGALMQLVQRTDREILHVAHRFLFKPTS